MKKRHPYAEKKQKMKIQHLRERVPDMYRALSAEDYYLIVNAARKGLLADEDVAEFVLDTAPGVVYTQVYNDAIRLAGKWGDLVSFDEKVVRGRLCKDGPLSGTLTYKNTEGKWTFSAPIEKIGRIRETMPAYKKCLQAGSTETASRLAQVAVDLGIGDLSDWKLPIVVRRACGTRHPRDAGEWSFVLTDSEGTGEIFGSQRAEGEVIRAHREGRTARYWDDRLRNWEVIVEGK